MKPPFPEADKLAEQRADGPAIGVELLDINPHNFIAYWFYPSKGDADVQAGSTPHNAIQRLCIHWNLTHNLSEQVSQSTCNIHKIH